MEGEGISDKLKKLFSNPNFVLASRILLGIVFIYASIDKIYDPAVFSDNIDNYHATPVYLNNLIALIIPWMELFIGLCLVSGKYIEGASVLSVILLIVFILLIGQALIRGIDLHCGCFKNVTDLSAENLKLDMIRRIIEDILLVIISITILLNVLKMRFQ